MIATTPARVTGVWTLAAGSAVAVIAAAVGAWPSSMRLAPPVPFVAAPAPVTVPLDGHPDGAAGTCVEMLDQLVEYPQWALQINERASGCLGTDDRRQITIAGDGWMTWRADGLPTRRVRLLGFELDAIRGLDRLGCEREYRGDYGERFFELGWGAADTHGGIHIAAQTPIGHRIDEVVDAAIARYTAARRVEIALTKRRFTVDGYRFNVDGRGTLTVRRGHRMFRERLDDQVRVDLFDALAAGAPTALYGFGDASPFRLLANAVDELSRS
jgi:hypothetical protein